MDFIGIISESKHVAFNIYLSYDILKNQQMPHTHRFEVLGIRCKIRLQIGQNLTSPDHILQLVFTGTCQHSQFVCTQLSCTNIFLFLQVGIRSSSHRSLLLLSKLHHPALLLSLGTYGRSLFRPSPYPRS